MSGISLIDVDRVSGLIMKGGVGVLPTDTLYGLVCSAKNTKAVERLYSLKNRDKKPGTIIASSIDQLVDLGLKQRYMKPVARYWPGPISVVIPCAFDLPYLHLGIGSLAVRVVDDDNLCKLIDTTGPLLTTSANTTGEREPTNIDMAHKYFGDQVDFYINGGDYSGRRPSTVIRVVDDAVEVLRQGAIIINETGEIQE